MDKKERSFLGRGWSFPPTFNKFNGSVEMVGEEEDIEQSLDILFHTGVGERFLRVEYGCDLRNYLFEALTSSIDAYIKDLVNTAILYHEPRIKLEDLSLERNVEESLVKIDITYIVHSTNTRRNRVFPFYLDEGTDL